MSLVWEQDGEDLVLMKLKREYLGGKQEVLRVNGDSGLLTVSKPAQFDGAVTLPAGVSLSMAAGDVGTAELAALAVTTAKIAADAVTNAKLADDSVDSEQYVDGSIDAAHFSAGAVDATALGSNAVTTAKLADANVTAAKLKQFSSTEQTGTGSSQNVAHGLAVTPTVIVVYPTAGHDGSGAAGTQMPTIAYGTHTSGNVVVTVSAGAKFRVLAIS